MNRLALFLAGVAVAVAVSSINYALDAELRSVQRGELALVCSFKNGKRTIEPSRVISYTDGAWVFDNGYARNCEIIKGDL